MAPYIKHFIYYISEGVVVLWPFSSPFEFFQVVCLIVSDLF
jgi:hypothetical protein